MENFNFCEIESEYNEIPEDISTRQKNKCSRCYYRLYNLQLEIAKDEAKRKGGSVKDYLQGFYIKEEAIKECKREKCLLEEKAQKEPFPNLNSVTILLPKNSGLREKILEIIKDKKLKGKIIEARGEDIPLIIDKGNGNLIGITGEDLYKEYILENYNSKLKILERIPWVDEKAIFKKPALCLLGKKGQILENMPKNLKVAINKKYQKIAKKYLNNLEVKGYNFNKIYFSGSTEEVFQLGLVDLVVDIVLSGKSAEKAGLEVYDKIFESDIVIIRRKDEK